MKIRKLTIHNIASIEDAVIDFTQSPLSDSDIFLITGDTGSGKSTILDALCLALYANTPRMKNTEMEGAIQENSGIKLQVEDPRRMLREGAGEGFVTLEFDGSNGVPYKACWSVNRAYNKATGRLQGKVWKLENLRTNRELTRDKEIADEIKMATGLSTFDQFCQTTMLAQGEFTRFLNSKDEDKAAILEKITGADIYARIGMKIYDLSQAKTQAYKLAKQNAEGNAALSPEDRQAKETEKQDLENLSKEEGVKKKDCERKRQFLSEERRLNDLVEKAKEDLDNAEKEVGTEEFARKATRVKDYEETIEVRAHLATFEKKSQEAGRAEQAIGDLAGQYVSVRAGLAFLKQERQEMQDQLARVQTFFEKEKPDLPVIEKAQTVEGHLKTLTDGKEHIAAWENRNKGIEAEISTSLRPDVEKKKKEWTDAKTNLQKAESHLEAASKAVKDANLPRVREELAAKRTLEANIGIAQLQLGVLTETVAAREKEKKQIETDENALSVRKKDRDGLTEDLAVKVEVFKQAEKTYDKVKLAAETRVEEIRGALSEGDICPVCRQKIVSVLPTSTEVSAIILPVREAYEQAKEQKEEAEGNLRELNSRLEVAEKDLTRRKHQYDSTDPVSEKRSAALAALDKCGITELTETAENDLKALSTRTKDEIKVLEGKDQAGKELESAESRARETEKACRKEETKAKEAYDTADLLLKGKQNEIETNKKRSADEQQRMDEAKAGLVVILAGSRWEKDWESDLKVFGEDLKAAVENHKRNELQKGELEKALQEDLKPKIEAVEAHLETVVEKEPGWPELPQKDPEEIQGIRKAADGLKVALLEKLQILASAKVDAAKADEEVGKYLGEHSDFTRERLKQLSLCDKGAIQADKRFVEEAHDRVRKARTEWETQKNNLSEHLKTRPELEDGMTEESLQTVIDAYDQSMTARAGQIALIQQELDDDDKKRKQQGSLQKIADDLKIEADLWGRLCDMFGNADGKEFRKIAQSYVLGSLVEAANGYMAAMTDRYTMKVHPGTFIIELEDAYQGYASRVASTISGGESFLVSLSLALALSDIGTGISVDTLFIDEGFGSLSGEPLQRAVDMLKSLHKQIGRHVGIISHIKDLREKIPVKILVERPANSSASTVTVEEKDR